MAESKSNVHIGCWRILAVGFLCCCLAAVKTGEVAAGDSTIDGVGETAIQQLIDDGRYSKAARLAYEYSAEVAASRGTSSVAAADARDLLIRCLILNRRERDPETRRLAQETLRTARGLYGEGHLKKGIGL